MRRIPTAVLAATLALGAVAAHEQGHDELVDHPCYDAETGELAYPTEQVWFHEGDRKLANDSAAPWDTTEPTASVTDGAGAGVVSPGTTNLAAGTPADTYAVFEGTFTGCIDTLLVDLYSFDPTNRTGTSGSAQPAAQDFGLTITIDGVDVFAAGPLEGRTEFANEGMGPNLNRFALNLKDDMELFEEFDMIEQGGEHTIRIAINSWYVNTNHVVYVWDTSEVPSGMTFNGEITEDYGVVG